MNKVTFKSKKEATEFLKEKGINTSNWTEEKWQSINKSQAEIHIQALAESMWDAMNESTPRELKDGEWHIPFGDKIDREKLLSIYDPENKLLELKFSDNTNIELEKLQIKIATARCARISYMTFDGEINYKKDIILHDSLLENRHFSPFEHCAKAMTSEEYATFVKGKLSIENTKDGIKLTTDSPDKKGWCDNFKGFISYRYLINED